jgi:peptidoglycan hydrolase-like protein with peptidoglycan-binding domain
VARDIAVTADVSITNRYADRDTVDPNLPDPVTKAKLYPQFARVNFWTSTANNSYRALLLKVDKRLTNHYQFLVSYTLSKAMDTQATNQLGDRYGFFSIERYGAADRRHRLVTSGIVQLPADVMLSTIADFRSSLRFAPSSALDLNGDGYSIDLPAGVMPGSGCRDMNLDAVNTFRRGRGLTEVTTVDCPGFANVDLRLSKTFRVGTARAEFIAQLFNIFNRANFNAPNNSVTAGNDTAGRPLFGQSTTLLPNINAPSRQAEFAVRFQF